MIDAIQASEIVGRTPGDKIESGADAHWVNIDAYWGIKYFGEPYIRDTTHQRQSLAYSLGMAPAIGDKLDFKIANRQWYGYTSERICETAWEALKARQAIGIDDDFTAVVYSKVQEYKDILQYQGLYLYDMHNMNYGFNANGDIVIIDFSRCQDEEESQSSENSL